MEIFNSSFVTRKLENAMSGFNPQILLQRPLLGDSRQFHQNSRKNGLQNDWAGLGKNADGTALIDDAPEYENWFCAIGATTYWPEKFQIPGPFYRGPGFTSGGVSEVNLYLKIVPLIHYGEASKIWDRWVAVHWVQCCKL